MESGDQLSEPLPGAETVTAPPTRLSPPAYARLIALIEILLCSSVPTQIVLAAFLGVLGIAPLTADRQLSLPFVLALSLGDTCLLIGLMVLLMRARGQNPKALWLGNRSPGREVLFGLGLVPIVFGLVIAVLGILQVFAPGLHNVPTNPLEQLAAGGATNAAAFALVAIFAGGVREELQRAFLLNRFEEHLGGAKVGVVVLSVAFGLGHMLQGWDAVITTGMLGAFWAIIYLRRRSSVAPVVSHAGFNSLEILRIAIGVS